MTDLSADIAAVRAFALDCPIRETAQAALRLADIAERVVAHKVGEPCPVCGLVGVERLK